MTVRCSKTVRYGYGSIIEVCESKNNINFLFYWWTWSASDTGQRAGEGRKTKHVMFEMQHCGSVLLCFCSLMICDLTMTKDWKENSFWAGSVVSNWNNHAIYNLCTYIYSFGNPCYGLAVIGFGYGLWPGYQLIM